MSDSIQTTIQQHSEAAKYLSLIPSSTLGVVAWSALFAHLVKELQAKSGNDNPNNVIIAGLVGGALARLVSELAEELSEVSGISNYVASSTIQGVVATTIIENAARIILKEPFLEARND